MHPPDASKTAFITDCGVFAYKKMSFGLKNAGATYQRFVNQVFRQQIGEMLKYVSMTTLSKVDRWLTSRMTWKFSHPARCWTNVKPDQMHIWSQLKKVSRVYYLT